MTNKQISTVFYYISWAMLGGSVSLHAPLFIFYSLVCIGLSMKILLDQKG